jgi:hypothetical protein
MRRFARLAGFSLIVLAALPACDPPTGLVISVRGGAAARELWLAAGTADADQQRFVEARETGVVPSDGPFPDGFEIYLDRPELTSHRKVALVLDAIVGEGRSLDVLRDSYVVAPDADGLLEVRLTPRPLGAGQWVCWGRSGADRVDPAGFTIGNASPTADCDRDGWPATSDPDDADPLSNGELRLARDLDGAACQFRLGARRLSLDASDCAVCAITPQCLSSLESRNDVVHCDLRHQGSSVPVAKLMSGVQNPQWELVPLGSEALAPPPPPSEDRSVQAVFLPSNRALDEWSVQFSAAAAVKTGWFALGDRSSGRSVLIVVQFKGDADNSCE